jgi:phage tail sheath protein FI
MAFQLSPGVNVTEIDLTTVVPAVATSDGAFAGVFRWGPIGERVLIDSENNLVKRFGAPTNLNPETFFTAANFLAYANRLYISRAANTTGVTPYVSANISGVNTSVLITGGNISSISVGMYVTQFDNAAGTGNIAFYSVTGTKVTNVNTVTVASKNASHIVLTKPLSIATSNSTALANGFTLYFSHPETAYTAVGLDYVSNTSAKVANLVNQIVKNENEYTTKDGAFDEDVIYAAKYPGELGNSLRVAICDNANSFNSTMDFTPSANVGNSSVNTAVSTAMEFSVGSNVAYVRFPNTSSAQVLAAQTYASRISTYDRLLAGNSEIGLQYLKVTGTEVLTNAYFANTIQFDGSNASIDSVQNFIIIANSSLQTNPYANGDQVTYNLTGTGTIGLTDDTKYFVVEANTLGIKLSTTAFGAPIDLTANTDAAGELVANTTVLKINFEDPYRLRTNYRSDSVDRYWEFFNVVDTAPGQSDYVLYNGNTAVQDELHVVVVDDDGAFTGVPGTILEVYKGLSRATDAKNVDGTNNYYKDIINQNSKYVWWTKDRSVAISNTASTLTNSSASAPGSIVLQFGADGHSESNATLGILGNAYDLFSSTEDIDISLVLQGKPVGGTTVVNGRTVQNFMLANYIIDNIVGGSNFDPQNPNGRRDCVAFVSPSLNTVLNNVGDEALDLKAWRGAIHSSSYAVMDSGYKYQYDRYNNVYRWIPLNGDIAGTCVRTDNTNDAWWSPAGFNRGQIKNLVKLAFNPKKSERDIIYPVGINPVVTFPGEGTVLFGDKTLQSKPSAFDRINVRRLFIVLEKAISTAAKYSLFEFNDAFTRAQFKNLVVPYLRTIKGRRGITEFLVVCDDTNNTPQIIDSNQFVGDIYIKPARSINFIQLNFVAVPTGVQFSEVVGKF